MTHYFETPDSPERRRTITARFWDHDWTFTTSNGVFSADGLDLGTAVLLRSHAPDPSSHTLLDLGCGYGVLAAALATACPAAHVDAVDINERALTLTRHNAEVLGLGDRITAVTPPETDPHARYDEIWSNPPIRVGKQALHDLLTLWLPRLAPTGVARLVVGRNLGADSLQRWLVEQGWHCERTASAKGFRVFAVTHGSGSDSRST